MASCGDSYPRYAPPSSRSSAPIVADDVPSGPGTRQSSTRIIYQSSAKASASSPSHGPRSNRPTGFSQSSQIPMPLIRSRIIAQSRSFCWRTRSDEAIPRARPLMPPSHVFQSFWPYPHRGCRFRLLTASGSRDRPRNSRPLSSAHRSRSRLAALTDGATLSRLRLIARSRSFAGAPIPSRPCLAPASRLLKAPSVRLVEFAARRATPACSEPSPGVQATRVPSA